jgi:hypothetical protein
VVRGSELVVLLVWIPTIWALFEALRTPARIWADSEQSQAVWVVVILLLPVIGPLMFLFIARPRLIRGS